MSAAIQSIGYKLPLATNRSLPVCRHADRQTAGAWVYWQVTTRRAAYARGLAGCTGAYEQCLRVACCRDLQRLAPQLCGLNGCTIGVDLSSGVGTAGARREVLATVRGWQTTRDGVICPATYATDNHECFGTALKRGAEPAILRRFTQAVFCQYPGSVLRWASRNASPAVVEMD